MVAPPKNTRIIKMGAITYAHLLRLLMEGEYTCKELAKATGLHYTTVLQYSRELYRARVLHICAWRERERIYKVGDERDVKRPKMTAAERTKHYRERQKVKQQTSFLYGAAHANQTTGS